MNILFEKFVSINVELDHMYQYEMDLKSMRYTLNGDEEEA